MVKMNRLSNSKNFKGFKKQSFLNRLEEQGSSKSLGKSKTSQSKRGMILVARRGMNPLVPQKLFLLVLIIFTLSLVLMENVEGSKYVEVKVNFDDCVLIDPIKKNWASGKCWEGNQWPLYNGEWYGRNVCPPGLVVIGSKGYENLVDRLVCCGLTGTDLTYSGHPHPSFDGDKDRNLKLNCDEEGKSAYCPGEGESPGECPTITGGKNWIVWGGDADGNGGSCDIEYKLEHLYCSEVTFGNTCFPEGEVYINNTEPRLIDAERDCKENEVVCGFKNKGGEEDHIKELYCCPIVQPPPEDDGDGGCNDGLDNDKDGLTDCFDEDCNLGDYPFDDPPVYQKCKELYDQNETMCTANDGSWVDTITDADMEDEVDREKNRCCGDDLAEELGEIRTDDVGNNYICLNNDEGLVGHEGELAGWPEGGTEELPSRCQGGWCWILATSDAAFHIFTIKKPEKPAYDVVSNNNDWFECKDGEGTKGISQGIIVSDDRKNANRFYCYQEGERWSWADCRDPNEPIQASFNGIKERKPGDGLFALTTTTPTGSSIMIDLESYDSFYKDLTFDITGYINLEFMVRFISEDIILPAGVFLTIFGPEREEGGYEIYFNKGVLAYATNNPLIEKERWIHVKIPIPEMLGINGIEIESIPEENKIEVKNVYLSKSDRPKLCSGETSRVPENSAWLDNLDFWESGNPISGEKICSALYDLEGGKAWLGDGEVSIDERRCCGNDLDEYYSGDSKHNYGCWNSQVIGPRETTMNVEFEVGSEPFIYTCNQEECLYPLRGFPEYKITNLHPELYELWFVSVSGEFLVDRPEKSFDVSGNLKAKKVAQQVIFVNEETEEEQGFFGCQAVNYLDPYLEDNLNYCSVKGDRFCAYQDSYEKDYALINSWSSEPLTEWGYQRITEREYSEGAELELVENDQKQATERNYSGVVVPGRNFLTNAEFTKKVEDDLVGWEIFDNGGIHVDEGRYKRDYVDDGTLILLQSYTLKSERIAVEKGQNILFTANATCTSTIIFYDRDGKEVVTSPVPMNGGTNYYSGTASYLILEFTGACQIKQPMLQLVDDLGAADYSYKTEYPERAGAACCPQNWCWNGYACVKEMSESTYMVEKVGEERFYRCIQGEWKYLPVQWDWNFEEFGFCSKKEQCFVINSLAAEADSEAKAEDFYEGRFPICIDNTEFIFDHYCEEGKWTSRTKFLASTLLDAYGSDDFILYCTNYPDALLDYENIESSLERVGVESEGNLLGSVEEKLVPICFKQLLTGEGERLVDEEENTCINNVCVLRFKEGGKFKTVFATTLNKEIDAVDSFLKALNVHEDSCQGEEELIECDLGVLGGDLWYLPELKAVVYGKEGVRVESGISDSVQEWFANLFGIELEETRFKSFIKEATNFNELYLLNKDGKKVRAIQEIFPENKTLIAEYENFETPICEYVKKRETPTRLQILEIAGGGKLFACDIAEDKQKVVQKVVISEDLDFWWPQLTGKLRVG